jgi:transcriptional regulator with XRE-family HTH domain
LSQEVIMDVVAERARRRWTQEELAERAKVHVATVRRMEQGRDVLPLVRAAIEAAFAAAPVFDAPESGR